MSRWYQVSASVAAMMTLACSRDSGPLERAAQGAATIDDRRPIPEPNATPTIRGTDWWRVLANAAEPTRAGGVTPLDEVPDSSWFTNRNAARRLSPEAIRRGPAQHRAPRDDQTWTVIGVKQEGAAIGLRARDEAGDEFFLKLDARGHDEVETGADIVVQRLLFAAGYNVPENDVVYLARKDLSIAHGAQEGEGDTPLRDDKIDALLVRAAQESDGRYRVLASRMIAGKPVGTITPFGASDDDPNDRIPHEDRRDMRGLYSLAAWLHHVDVKPPNTLAVWVPDRRDSSRGHVVHYLLDFGKSLGAMGRIDRRLYSGFAYSQDLPRLAASHLTTGTQVPWANAGPFPDLRGLGWIESARFDPARWRPMYPWLPFDKADRFDKLWGARIVASFTPQQIRAALDAARYSEPRTVDFLARVLAERQRKTLEQHFRGVAPLERFEMRRGALCFVDLWTRHGLGGPAATYTAEIPGPHPMLRARVRRDGTVCFANLPRDLSGVITIRIARAGHVVPSTRVSIAAQSSGGPRVTAIDRQ